MVTNVFEVRRVNHTPRSFPKDLSNLTETFKGTYIRIRDRWGYTARISSLLEMIQYSYGLSEWELIELRDVNNGDMESEWMDSLIAYRKGEEIDFGDVWEKIKNRLTFSTRELNLIETGGIDERLWAIYTLLTDQTLPIIY